MRFLTSFGMTATLFFCFNCSVLAQPIPQFPGAGCRTTQTNLQGSSNADITVDNTSGGVTVMAASTARCAALIKNTGVAAMRCDPTTITVTATAGQLVNPGETLVLGLEGQQAWKCIRTTATSTSVNASEAYP